MHSQHPTSVRSTTTSHLEPLERRTLLALMTFTVDPALSTLRLSGEVADVIELEEQRRGSLIAAYEGTIVADVTDASISFGAGGSDVIAQARGNFDPGDAPANYAGEGTTGGFLEIRAGEAAVRGLRLDVTSADVLTLNTTGGFDATGLRLAITAGELEFDVRVGGDGSIGLDGNDAGNNGAGLGTLAGAGDNRTLRIPVDITVSEDQAELRFRGTLVATAGTGAPPDFNAASVGADGARSVTFTDADGTVANVSMRGGGVADLRFENATGQSNLNGAVVVSGAGVRLLSVSATGTTAASNLAIRAASGGDRVVDVPSLTTDGGLKGLGGPGVNFAGDVSVAGHAARVTAARLTGATLNAGSIGSLAVAGAITGSRVATAGSIVAVRAGSLSASQIFAGVVGADVFPDALDDLPSEATIGKLTIRSFDDSVIAANNLGRLSLGAVDTDNAGEPFGVAADSVLSLRATGANRQRLRLGVLDDPAALPALLAAQNFTFGDFQIRVL